MATHGPDTPEARFPAHIARYGPKKKPPKKVKIPVLQTLHVFYVSFMSFKRKSGILKDDKRHKRRLLKDMLKDKGDPY